MYKRLINILPKTSTPITPLLLDTYPNAALALSLRKVRNSYTGPAIRVSRSTDNAEQDIYFDSNGDLDTESILNFVGDNMYYQTNTLFQTSTPAWAASNLNTTGTPPFSDVEIAPDGTLTGDKMIENTTTSLHSLLNNIAPFTLLPFAITPNDNYNFSFYLKKGERTEVRFRTTMSGCAQTCNQFCDINLNDGSISNNTFPNTPIVTSEPNGWYRFSVTVYRDINAFVTVSSRLILLSGGSDTYLGDGVSGIYVWGKQLTRSSEVKPYFPVTGSGLIGNVVRIYDQSGNDRHQSVTTGRIIQGGLLYDGFWSGSTADSAGVTTLPTGKVALWNISIPVTGLTTTQQYLLSSVFRRRRTASVLNVLNGASSTAVFLRWNASTANTIQTFMNTSQTHATDPSLGRFLFTTSRDSLNAINVWKNGNALTPGSSSATGTTVTNVGFADHLFQELIYWENTQDSNRVGIQNNVNNYWSIY